MFIRVSGQYSMIYLLLSVAIWPASEIFICQFRFILTASYFMAIKPILCLVRAYYWPAFPKPTIKV